jgi:apolipoprotein N-acyltransferase
MLRRTPHWSLALIAGLVFPLGLAPFDFWPIIPLSAGLLYALLSQSGRTTPVRIGLAYGAGFFGAGVSWVYVSIHVYGNTPVWLAISLTTLFCGGLALLFAAQARLFARLASKHAAWKIAQFASLWVLFEWLRSWLLTGFPWAYAGYGALDSPLAGWIPVVGVYGCSWLLVLLGCLWVEALRQPRILSRWAIAAVGTGLVTASGALWEGITWTTAQGEALTVAVVQPNVPLKEKWDPRQRPHILAEFSELTTGLHQNYDLVVWPESALPGYRDRLRAVMDPIDQQAEMTGSTLITGIPTRDSTGRYNSIVALGAGSGTYHKQKLVPFGEYVPLERWLRGLIAFFDLPMSQFSAGPANQRPLMAGDVSIAPFICYEVVYPDFVQRYGSTAALLVTISNDTWFGKSVGPWQHFQMARYRAVELERDLIRGTNDGVSALISAEGLITSSAEQFREAVITGNVQPRTGQTPFALTGSLPVWVFSLIMLVLGRDRA